MTSEEYKIIQTQRRTYLVEKPDGRRVYVCKECGEEIGDMSQIAKHFAQKHRSEKTEATEEEIKVPEQRQLEKSKIPTPEEEMLEEMCKVLKPKWKQHQE
jgi:hypothetical protein